MKHFTTVFLSALFLTACALKPVRGTPDENLAWTDSGIVADGVRSHLGIEYARAERWQLPTLVAANSSASNYDMLGPACPQDGIDQLTERCLYLNVFAPAEADLESDLPVFVWIHGGGFRTGRGDERLSFLAKSGMIVITFNYRLGVLGFHDQADWPLSRARNFGQADMVKALEWVGSNIHLFGGNPDNVTLGGHSAGGMGVQLMMVDPRARGLFHRAFSDAGYGTWPFPYISNGKSDTTRQVSTSANEQSLSELVERTPFFHLPYIGAEDLPRQPIDVFRAGDQAQVPYMAGANSFDGHGTLEAAGFNAVSFFEKYDQVDGVASGYADDQTISVNQAAERLFGDMRYVFASEQTVKAMADAKQPAYMFYFDHEMGGFPGTPHGWHYGLVLNDASLAFTEYLTSFIKSGEPSSGSGPQWQPYSDARQSWMVFSPDPSLQEAPLKQKMQTIETLVFPMSQQGK